MLHCVLIVLLNDHTLSLVPLHLCPSLHFMHFNSCVCSIAPLVASAFPFVCVCHALHPALRLASLCCMFHLCIFACLCLCVSVFLCISIKLHHCALCYCIVLTSFRFTNFILHLHSLTSAFLGATELQQHSHFVTTCI
jgi:hypothetical protein